MASSTTEHISDFMRYVNKIQPKNIVDIGIGFGRWGFLCRELLDGLHGRFERISWKTNIVGIEIFNKFITSLQKYIYSRIFIDDGYAWLKNYAQNNKDDRNIDLIIFGDVLEHMPKEKAIKCLELGIALSNYVLAGIPIGYEYKQGECFGNPYEAHLCEWTVEELKKYGEVTEYRDKKNRPYALLFVEKLEAIK